MKKLLVVSVALLMAVCANAQIGIIGGITSSSTDLETAYADVKNVTQYHVGLAYKLPLGSMLAIQPALIYNVKGQKLSEVTGTGDIDFKTGYLELPVQVQVGIPILSVARVYGFAEPFVGYAISNEVGYNFTSKEETSKTWDNIESRIEYGIGLGAGVELIQHVQISVRYFWNLGNVYGADINVGDIIQKVSTSKCNGISASVALLF